MIPQFTICEVVRALNVKKKEKEKKYEGKGNVETFNDARLEERKSRSRWKMRGPSLSSFRDRFVLREMEKRLGGRYTRLTRFVGKI